MLLREMDGDPFHPMPSYDFLSGNGYSLKQLVRSNSDIDSSSSKSKQSWQDLSDSSLSGQHTPTQSDNNDICGKRDQGMVKSVLSFSSPEAAFPPHKLPTIFSRLVLLIVLIHIMAGCGQDTLQMELSIPKLVVQQTLGYHCQLGLQQRNPYLSMQSNTMLSSGGGKNAQNWRLKINW